MNKNELKECLNDGFAEIAPDICENVWMEALENQDIFITEGNEKNSTFWDKIFRKKAVWGSLGAALACVCLCLFLGITNNEICIIVDVNPSIEILTDNAYTVKKMQALNVDGQHILDKMEWEKNDSIENVMDDLLEELANQDYLQEGSGILLSVSKTKEEQYQSIQENLGNRIYQKLETMEMTGVKAAFWHTKKPVGRAGLETKLLEKGNMDKDTIEKMTVSELIDVCKDEKSLHIQVSEKSDKKVEEKPEKKSEQNTTQKETDKILEKKPEKTENNTGDTSDNASGKTEDKKPKENTSENGANQNTNKPVENKEPEEKITDNSGTNPAENETDKKPEEKIDEKKPDKNPTENSETSNTNSDTTENNGDSNTGKNPTGNTGNPDAGKNPTGNTGNPDAGKNPTGNTGNPDAGKNPTGNSENPDTGKNPAGNSKNPDTGKNPTGNSKNPDTGKNPTGNTGNPDAGKNPAGNNPAETKPQEGPPTGNGQEKRK